MEVLNFWLLGVISVSGEVGTGRRDLEMKEVL
jgi:hypothetical protein